MVKRKKWTWYGTLLLVILIGLTCVLVYQLAFAKERDERIIMKLSTLIITYICAISGFSLRRRPNTVLRRTYADAYRETLGDAFANDRSSYRRLMQAIYDYNHDRHVKAIRILDRLYEHCVSSQERTAVLTFKALALTDSHQSHLAMETYEELLQLDAGNSQAWSNLGLLYAKDGRSQEAEEAYKAALRCDSRNAFAYGNLAAMLLRRNQMEEALEHARRALELNNNLYAAASAAAIACAALGEEEQAVSYYQIYAAHTDKASADNLRIMMQAAERR